MKDVKRQIIQTMIQCIASVGPRKASANLVAKELGIVPSLVFYHFPKQNLLFEAVTAYIVQCNADAVVKKITQKKCTTVFDQLECYIEAHLEWVKKRRDQVGVFVFATVDQESQMAAIVLKSLDEGQKKIHQMLEQGVQAKEFAPLVENADVSKTIHDLLIANILALYLRKAINREVDAACQRIQCLARVLLGIPITGKSRSK